MLHLKLTVSHFDNLLLQLKSEMEMTKKNYKKIEEQKVEELIQRKKIESEALRNMLEKLTSKSIKTKK